MMIRLSFAVAVWAVGWPESMTLKVTEVVPTSLCCGVPVIAPVELPIERSLGSPDAL